MESGTSKIAPIFIFSLPRSGSTLLQKIIASSNEVSTSSEPWILLPLLYSQKEEGTLSEYSHKKAVLALNDVKQRLLDNSKNFDDILVNFILSVYEGLSNPNSKYFLDKTPRYYLIIEEISNIFPNAKFIFLFRNPLAQFASKMNTHKGRFKTLYSAIVDIGKGPNLLVSGYKQLQEGSIKINYSELVNDSKLVIRRIENYLNIKIDESVLNNLSEIDIKGVMGDPTLMANKASKISLTSIDKWKTVFNSPLRRKIATWYLETIDEEYYRALGISKAHIKRELKKVKIEYFKYPKDYFDLVYFFINAKFKPYLFFSKRREWVKNIRLD